MKGSRDTTFNPGSDRQLELLPLATVARKTAKLLFDFKVRKAVYYFIAQCSNHYRSGKKRKSVMSCKCSVCGKVVPFFFAHASDLHISFNSICPRCSSRSRHRGLKFVYDELLESISRPVRVLHVAPEPIFYRLFKENELVSYETMDYFLDDVDYKEDIQLMSFAAGQYDFVLCNHVLEHVPDDAKALSEISRILAHDGRAIITIPGNFKKHKTTYFKHLRYNGHYRDYGLDVADLMKQHFRKVEMKDLSKYNKPFVNYGIKEAEIAFICSK